MQLYGNKEKSIPQKSIVLILETIILLIGYWILFGGGFEKIFPGSSIDVNYRRRLILFVFNCIVYVRMWITITWLVKRQMPWEEAFSIPFAFAIYYIGFALLGAGSSVSLDSADLIGIAIFLFGSFINTLSELFRDSWKNDKKNKGRLYTGGLFRYSMHVNYFGDLLWVSGYAVLTRNIYSGIIVSLIFCFFACYNIPKLDKYLASKYGNEFTEYRKKTKKFIPFIY